jgi:type I restriction enzyme S subunit
MNAQSFLNNFHTIARAPGGVSRMRDLVYFFAITGGLSQTEAGDSDANLILDDSLQAKLEYYEENSVRQGARKHSEIFQVVKRVPNHWVMVSAGDLIHLINGRAFKSTDWRKSGLPIIRIQNLNNSTAPFNYFQGEVSEGHRVRAGDMLLSWSGTPGTSFGAFIWNGGDAVLNQHIFKVAIYSSKISKEYLRMAINASLDALIGSARGGVGLKHVTKGQIESLQIPLPPLEEQNRIVAKVDELMRLCDRLDAQQQERENLLPLLSRANHTRFITKPTIKSLTGVFHQHGTVSPGDMRETVLSLAARGFLAEQNPEDDSVDELLSRIQMQREECESSDVEDVSSDEEFFAIPKSWRWVRLGNISTHSDSGWSPQCKETRRVGDEWGILKVSAVSWGRFLPEENKGLPASEIPRPGCEVRDGDFLMSRANTFELVAKSVIVEAPPPHLMLSDKIVRFHLPAEIDKSYINLFNLSPWARQYYAKNASGTSSSMKNVSRKVMSRLPIPFPPAAEQRRIVSRVRQFMSLIDRLEQQTNENRKIAASFARAAVAAITSTDFTENESMKPPKTEVVTALKVGKKPKKTDAAPLATLLSEQKADASAKTLWQLSGLEIDAFYRQLKKETANGWIEEDTSKRDIKEVEVG